MNLNVSCANWAYDKGGLLILVFLRTSNWLCKCIYSNYWDLWIRHPSRQNKSYNEKFWERLSTSRYRDWEKALSSVLEPNDMQWLCDLIFCDQIFSCEQERLIDYLSLSGCVVVAVAVVVVIVVPHICYPWTSWIHFILQLMTPNSKQLECPGSQMQIMFKKKP